MRLDVFLRNTRLMRRSVAKRAAASGRILVNGKKVKAAGNVRVGDVVVILNADDSSRGIKILSEAGRPVPRGREGEYFEDA